MGVKVDVQRKHDVDCVRVVLEDLKDDDIEDAVAKLAKHGTKSSVHRMIWTLEHSAQAKDLDVSPPRILKILAEVMQHRELVTQKVLGCCIRAHYIDDAVNNALHLFTTISNAHIPIRVFNNDEATEQFRLQLLKKQTHTTASRHSSPGSISGSVGSAHSNS